MNILVTGGAGYIGSIVVEQLVETTGDTVIVYDNLYQGHKEAVHPDATLVIGDLADANTLAKTFDQYQIDAIMHFASYTLVGESGTHPFKYLGDNITNGLNLLRAAIDSGVERFILSSTANLFDEPEQMPISEKERIVPGSPYGESKFILERMLYWLNKTKGLRYAALRYFNAAGASPVRGEDHDPETHLIPLVLEVAQGKRDKITLFGNDYPTPDGTCVRDYIHVLDLAQAHILALQALQNRPKMTYNLGNGQGYSNLKVVQAARKITGHPIPSDFGPRRPGDPAILIASAETLKQELGWQPQHSDLETIISDAWRWFQAHPQGYASS